MNCKQVQEFLPLFVGRDLKDRRAKQVAAHLQTCAHCAGATDEYRGTRQMLQQFSPPPFSEGVYAAMRQRVLREIEADSNLPVLSRFISGLFRPRLSWAIVSALLVVLALSAIYFIANHMDRPQLVVNLPIASHEQSVAQSALDQQLPLPSLPNDGSKRPRPAIRQRHSYRSVVIDSPDSVAMNAPKTSSTYDVSSKLNNSTESVVPADGMSAKPLRMEWQTNDPNIRIIWFSHPKTGRVGTGSKGI